MKVKKRGRVSQRNKEMMMVLIIRHPDVFAVAREILTPEHFSVQDVGFALVWRVILDFWDKYQSLPGRELLFAEIDKWLSEHPQELTREETEDLNSWVDAAYNEEHWGDQLASDTYVRWGIDTLKQVLSEQLAREISEEAITGSRVVHDLPGMVGIAQSLAERIETLDLPKRQDLFYEGWEQQGTFPLVSTGISFLDDLLDGGDRAGEAYGLMGPYGSCKTTLTFMLACERAYQAFHEKRKPDWDGKHGLAVLVCYETPTPETRHRLLMYAARVHRQSLENLGKKGLRSLSSSRKKNYRTYEKQIFSSSFACGDNRIPGEQERIQEATKILNEHLLVLDMTGFDESHPHAGSGYFPEIARRIKWELRQRKGVDVKVTGVYIDYVVLMARRHLRVLEGKDENYLRHLVGGAADEAKHLLAMPFRCPIWLVNQLNKEGNTRGPASPIDYTHSAEASNFAENLDFCFCAGRMVKHSSDNVCVIHAPKHRRTGQKSSRVLRMYGTLHRLVAADELGIKDHQIVHKNDMKYVNDGGKGYAVSGQSNGKNNWGVNT